MAYECYIKGRKIADLRVGSRRVDAVKRGSAYLWRRSLNINVRLGNTGNPFAQSYAIPCDLSSLNFNGRAYRLSAGYCKLTIAINNVAMYSVSGDEGGRKFSTTLTGNFKRGDVVSVSTTGKYDSGYADMTANGYYA